jgi:hypothetical protein
MRARLGPPLTGKPPEIGEILRTFAGAGISHLQVIVRPHTLAGVDAFGPILEALDHNQ